MKKLILVLIIAMTCATGFAAVTPEKDGPFPHQLAGAWSTQSGANKIFIKVTDLADGKVFLFASLMTAQDEIVATGETVVDRAAQYAKLYMVFSTFSEPMVVKFATLQGPNGPLTSLNVTLGDKTASFYRAP